MYFVTWAKFYNELVVYTTVSTGDGDWAGSGGGREERGQGG